MALEVRQRTSCKGGVAKQVKFSDIRGDWYRGADLMARLIARSGGEAVELIGFPVIWIPMFLHWNVKWSKPEPPVEYLPLFSEVDAREIERIARAAREHGQLRSLIEAAAALDPLLADVLHKLDRRKDGVRPVALKIPFTGWQSYGRPEVLNFESQALSAGQPQSDIALLLPCARQRPYGQSRTHKRLMSGLRGSGIVSEPADQIVISSLGVIPKSLWDNPIVQAYDSGVPDVYRILRLMRRYFQKHQYLVAIDCLEFEPYRDCLRILFREGLFEKVIEGPSRRVKTLPRP